MSLCDNNEKKAKTLEKDAAYNLHAAKVLVPLSESDNFAEALLEWYWDDHIIDIGKESVYCQLRGTGPSRYLCFIRHRDNPDKRLAINFTTLIRYSFAIQTETIAWHTMREDALRRYGRAKIDTLISEQILREFVDQVTENGDAKVFSKHLAIDPALPVCPLMLIDIKCYLERQGINIDIAHFQINYDDHNAWRRFNSLPLSLRVHVWNALSNEQRTHIIRQGYEVIPPPLVPVATTEKCA